MLRPGMYLQGRYEIIEKIGSGGMADVYKAMCHTLNRLVAVKVLKEEFSQNEDFVNRFKMEAQAVARFSHPNIVNVYDVVDDGDFHYIIMELIEGITLKRYIAKKGCLEVKETIGIAIQMAQGMWAAHQQNIIHRDIKPQNIIISKDGKVKVADFGIARAATSNTQEMKAIGSVHYISPEQARGEKVDARSDIYSLGITMFEMVTGRLPFDGENTVTVAMAHLQNPITPPKKCNPNIPGCLEDIILKCTEKRPDDRYSSVEEVLADLRRALINPNDGLFESHVKKEETDFDDLDFDDEMEEEPGGGKESSSGARSSGRHDRKHLSKQPHPRHQDDITHQFERIFSIAGVIAAIIIVAVLLIVVTRLGGLFFSRSSKPHTEETVESTVAEVTTAAVAEGQVTMPNLLTKPLPMQEDEARRILEQCGLQMVVSSVEYSNEVPAGYIMAQEYPEGTALEKHTLVNVKVSKGTGTIDLEAMGLIGMEQQAAKNLLAEKNLVAAVSESFSDTIPAGNVISYEPLTPKEGETVTLTVSKGSSQTIMPDVTGLTPEAADAALAAEGFVPGCAGEEYSDTIDAGLVFNQTAPPNIPHQRGTQVQYYISLGPEETMIGATHYVASINKQYNLSLDLGPGSSRTSVQIVVRLRQEVNGRTVAKDLIEPRTVIGDSVIPIVFSRIEGADGVEEGIVELVDLDNNKVLASYPVSFFKTED